LWKHYRVGDITLASEIQTKCVILRLSQHVLDALSGKSLSGSGGGTQAMLDLARQYSKFGLCQQVQERSKPRMTTIVSKPFLKPSLTHSS
jgi:hypothetical protein